MIDVYLSLGTNVGERLNNLKKAVSLIRNFDKSKLIKVSRIYETKPWGYLDQDDFLNLCIFMKTSLSPYELLDRCQEVEKELERVKNFRWGPRTMDVDILTYDELTNDDEKLTIPHKHLQKRAFVLLPLLDLAPNLKVRGKSIREWYNQLDEKEKENIKVIREKIEEEIEEGI